MGNCMTEPHIVEEKKKNKEIQNLMKKQEKAEKNDVKMVLLGAGESGKSTFFKQMKIIHLNGFSEEERESYASIVLENILTNTKELIAGLSKQGIELGSSQTEDAIQRINEIHHVDAAQLESRKEDIKTIWNDEGIRKVWMDRAITQINDNADYFFNEIDRILSDDYVPTDDDILRCRLKTTGITEISFKLKSSNFNLFDVGGQRNERRKWIHCFEDVRCVLFMSSMSEFDQKLREDNRTARIQESLMLWEEVATSRWFQNCGVVLFLNKRDLFEEKVKNDGVDPSVAFEEYKGGCDVDKAAKFLEKKYRRKAAKRKQPVHIHQTTATDTSNIRVIFDTVRESILLGALSNSGML
eukprot:gb/GECH01000725.1/.p1 GENE.gb/GECH01000725.1/~~gb/GECH01000725.1/.p1  ORF type:complete len:355 (+),score=108.05 gb/GECH01000725.1/:1-1065(+)